MTVIEGLIINIVDDDTFEMKVETTGGGHYQGVKQTVKIGGEVPRPLGRQYTSDFLENQYLGRRVRCVVETRDSQVVAIRVQLITESD